MLEEIKRDCYFWFNDMGQKVLQLAHDKGKLMVGLAAYTNMWRASLLV